jgi:hypothetical protein
MPTTRTEIMQAIELAALLLSAADSAANHRESFIDLLAMDPALVGRGRGRKAAAIIRAVLAALRERSAQPNDAVVRVPDADHDGESDGEVGAGHVGGTNDGLREEEAPEIDRAVRHHI